MKKHMVIIGGGITGVTSAYALAQQGILVTLIEKNRYPGMETSYANGGQLSASNAEVWTHPSTIIKGLKWMLQSDAPLLMNPAPTWHKLSWLAEFVAAIPKYKDNTIATTQLAIESREHHFAWAKAEGIDFDHKREGILHIYRDKKGFDHAGEVSKLLAQGGLPRRAVTPDEMKTIEPTLQGQYYGGYFTESDSTGDIHKFTFGLAKACERLGVKILTEHQVLTVASNGETATVQVQHAGQHPRRPHQAPGQLGQRMLPRRGHPPRGALGRSASHDAQHAAACGRGQEGQRVLQHRPRPPGLDAERHHSPPIGWPCDGRDAGQCAFLLDPCHRLTMPLHILPVDYQNPAHRQALVMLLDAYAQDPMGGGEALAQDVKARLCDDLAARTDAASFIAWLDDAPVGLVNCIEGYSTFKAQPLMNIHDIAVLPGHRGAGVGQALLAAAEQHAKDRGCCKLTLEVLTGNARALKSYLGFGFEPYALDLAAGQASFMQKWL
jgi:GNAT superfamily N-acetyltransferase